MKTAILTFDQIAKAVSLLKEGSPIAIPTETVYGLAAPVFNISAIEKIFSLKKRPQDNPLIVHISSLAMLDQLVDTLPPYFHLLIERFWPGPLTLILPKKSSVPSIVSAGQPSIAIRFPSHPLALALIDALGQPLVAPSANLSGKPSPTTALHVLEDFDGQIPAVLDGGPCALGIESTVLSLLNPIPTLLRPGSITAQQIEETLQLCLAHPLPSGPILSPGTKYRHYAPKAPIQIVSTVEEIQGPFLISAQPVASHPFRPLEAKSLYRHLREADALQVEEIFVLLDSRSSQDEALMNRLLKAAHSK